MQKLAARGQGPRYTSGMAAFDAALMQKDPQFQNLVNQVRAENRALERSAEGQADTLEDWAQSYGEGALTDAQTQAEDFIRNYNENLLAQQQAELQAYQDQIAGIDESAIQQEAVNRVLDRLIPELQQTTGYSDLREFAPNLEGDFVGTIDPGQFDYRDFIDANEAQRFNAIARLLGEGEAYGAGRAPTAEDLYRVDEAGIRDALQSGILGAKTADINRRTADIQRDIDLARSRNLGKANVRDFYERILPGREAAGEALSTIYRDGALITPEEEMQQRLADYRRLQDVYGDEFASLYDQDLSASDILRRGGRT
jgi:hypothetical protein